MVVIASLQVSSIGREEAGCGLERGDANAAEVGEGVGEVGSGG
jgi:hypothetical protein